MISGDMYGLIGEIVSAVIGTAIEFNRESGTINRRTFIEPGLSWKSDHLGG